MNKVFQITVWLKVFSYFFFISILIIPSINFSQNFRADFALYNPEYENDGVWEEEVEALKAMFFTYNWSFETIDHIDINLGVLYENGNLNYKALIAPGGYAAFRNLAVLSSGEQSIREFVQAGGNYVGFCAGSFWASDSIVWAENATGGGGNYNQESDYQNYNYDLDLFSGNSVGPFGWTPWENGDNASLELVKINNENSTISSLGIPDTTRFFYYGGPYFDKLPGNTEIWASAIVPENVKSEAKIGEEKPTVIKYNYSLGNVILFSYHPEVLINSMVDNLVLSEFVDEQNTSWTIGNISQSQINLDSWNIVHAALQIANNESVTKLDYLPQLLSIKIFLEGPFDDSVDAMSTSLNSQIPNISPYIEDPNYVEEIPNDIVDWVLIELRNQINSETIFTKSVFINNSGQIVNVDGTSNIISFNIPEGNYYLIVNHRNHLPVISSNLINFSTD